MTHVMNYSAAASLTAQNILKVYHVEVVTFDGEHFQEYVEAYTEEQAMSEAAALYSEVDYVMVQGSYAA